MVILAAAVTLLSEREASETVENKIYQKLKKEKMKCNFNTRFIFLQLNMTTYIYYYSKKNIDL